MKHFDGRTLNCEVLLTVINDCQSALAVCGLPLVVRERITEFNVQDVQAFSSFFMCFSRSLARGQWLQQAAPPSGLQSPGGEGPAGSHAHQRGPGEQAGRVRPEEPLRRLRHRVGAQDPRHHGGATGESAAAASCRLPGRLPLCLFPAWFCFDLSTAIFNLESCVLSACWVLRFYERLRCQTAVIGVCHEAVIGPNLLLGH